MDSPVQMSLSIFDFMGRGQTINIEKSLEKVEPNLHDDSEGFKSSVEEVTADTVEGNARKLEL